MTSTGLPPRPWPDDFSVRTVIDQRASEMASQVFVTDPERAETLTYGELKREIEVLLQRLARFGIAPGESIAFALSNSVKSVVVLLALFYGGYRATAINLVAGSRTIGYVLSHSEAKLILTQAGQKTLLEDAMKDLPSRPAVLDIDEASSPGGAALELAPLSGRDDGLLMYTSGTTGQPKGVRLSHHNLLAGGMNTAVAHALTPDDCAFCVLPLFHINALCVTVFGPLVSGGSLAMPARFSASQFWNQLQTSRATWFSVVPTQISYLLHDEASQGLPPDARSKLRFGRSASAPLPPEVQKAFEDRFGIFIIETMGLTETSAQILANPLPPGVRKIGSAGIAFGNEVIIGDEAQKELPRDQEGEVLVRGGNVMMGYLKNPEATEASLTPSGWLRTGDLGKMDADGYLFITGRLKELIIKGGENIAPREIDEALYEHPDLIEAAAFARPCQFYGQKVEAAVVVRPGVQVSEDELLNLCRSRLGAFKAPDRIHQMAELPKGPSGKIQRLKLTELVE